MALRSGSSFRALKPGTTPSREVMPHRPSGSPRRDLSAKRGSQGFNAHPKGAYGTQPEGSNQVCLGTKSACATAIVALLPPKPKALLSATPMPPRTVRDLSGT